MQPLGSEGVKKEKDGVHVAGVLGGDSEGSRTREGIHSDCCGYLGEVKNERGKKRGGGEG